MTVKKGRGRPSFVATDEDREKVRVLKAGGMSIAAIAEAVGISEPTLRKCFFSDLEIGAAKVTADVLMARYRAAIGGNVSAQNKLLDQLGAVPPKARREPSAPKLGKKEMLQAEAEIGHSGTEWGELLQ
jgi:hypothetical protein